MEADRELFCSCSLVPEVDLAVDVADQLGRGQCSQAGQGGGDANPGQEDGEQLQTDPDQAHRHVEEILGELISDIFHKQETSLIDAEIGENVRKVEKKNVVDMKCSGKNRIDQEENEKIDLNDLFLATNENDHDILNQEVVEETVKETMPDICKSPQDLLDEFKEATEKEEMFLERRDSVRRSLRVKKTDLETPTRRHQSFNAHSSFSSLCDQRISTPIRDKLKTVDNKKDPFTTSPSGIKMVDHDDKEEAKIIEEEMADRIERDAKDLEIAALKRELQLMRQSMRQLRARNEINNYEANRRPNLIGNSNSGYSSIANQNSPEPEATSREKYHTLQPSSRLNKTFNSTLSLSSNTSRNNSWKDLKTALTPRISRKNVDRKQKSQSLQIIF